MGDTQGQRLFAFVPPSWQRVAQAGASCRMCLLVWQALCGVNGWETVVLTFPSAAFLYAFCPLSDLLPASPPPRTSWIAVVAEFRVDLYCVVGGGGAEIQPGTGCF